jgi:hypothetical protein
VLAILKVVLSNLSQSAPEREATTVDLPNGL